MDPVLFKVTLENDEAGTLVISEPGGWESAKLKLVRNKEFHSLIELYDQPLTFYGVGLQNNGGLDFIRDIEVTQGLDALINISVEISHDEGYTYELLYSGTISLDTIKEIDFYKMEAGVLQESFWQKFINRKNSPINLAATQDLDGQSRAPVSSFTLPLPDQKITRRYRAEMYKDHNQGAGGEVDIIDYDFIQATGEVVSGIELPVIINDDLEERFTMTNMATQLVDAYTPIYEFFAAKYAGDYAIDIQLAVSTTPYRVPFTYDGNYTPGLGCWLRKNNESAIPLTRNNYGVQGTNGRTVFTYNNTIYLRPGDTLTLYFYEGSLTKMYFIIWPSVGYFEDSWIDISSATNYPDTQTESFRIKDALESIVSKITSRDNVILSSYLDACGGAYAIQKGFHVRGFTLAQKPFTMSFDDWWHGINPILNLGLAPEKTAGSPALDVIRVEQKSYFYDKTSTSINLDYVNNIERSYDFDSVFKMIELGYEEWAVESDNGLDDPQTKHTYNTRFKTVGKELSILSKFIGAALAIEETRRETDLKKDYRMDEKILIIALNENSSPVKPEMGIDFASVSNLLNPNTRYNIRISVARNFERWKDYFNGCLQWYVNSPGTEYLFAKGEGNLDMTSVLWGGGCESIFPTPDPVISEKQNIEATSDFLFMPIKYSFEHYLTWDQYKTIRDNRNKAIGVSRSNLGHVKCFVDELEYEITTGKTSFTVWLGENNPIV